MSKVGSLVYLLGDVRCWCVGRVGATVASELSSGSGFILVKAC